MKTTKKIEYTKVEDEMLAALLQQQDHFAYTEIYNQYPAALYIHIFNKLANGEEVRSGAQPV